jgi:hypothetical protein
MKFYSGILRRKLPLHCPVTTKLKELCPGKKIGKEPVRVHIVPQNRSAMNLKQHAGFFKKIQDRDLQYVSFEMYEISYYFIHLVPKTSLPLPFCYVIKNICGFIHRGLETAER